MKAGVFGGAFDPPHKEHINICLAAQEELNLDRVVLVPSGVQPHKTSAVSPNIRLEMVRAAVRPYRKLIIDDTEIKYSRIGYASEILPLLQIKYGEFIYILGGDSLLSLRYWMRPDIVLTYPIAVAVREGRIKEVMEEIEYFKETYNANIRLLKYKSSGISSSDIRARLELNKYVNEYIPETVLKIITDNNLYSEFRPMVDKVRKMVSEKTFSHIERTVIKAFEYNRLVGLPYDKVFNAALLHDIGKEIYGGKYIHKIPSDVVDTPVMHAFVGAEIAREEFAVLDTEILNAIRYHTTGRARMTQLEALIFIADMTEDGRDFEGVSKIRTMSASSIILAFLACVESQYEHLINSDTDMHPLTRECYNYYINKEIQ
jgi:nicotinate-nucleotide adenylyltransferase